MHACSFPICKPPPLVKMAAWFTCLFVVVLWSTESLGAELRTEVAARRVGVGQTFEVRITAVRKDGDPQPQSPRLPVRGEAEVRGPSVGSQRRIMMHNFNLESEESVVATWHVTPTKVGKIAIGPGTFEVGNQVLRGEMVVVEVVENAAPTPRRRPFDPRSIFDDNFDDLLGKDPFDDIFKRQRAAFEPPQAPDEYLPKRAKDPVAFLHVTVDKKRVVLGEPVRVSVLAFGSQGNFREISPNEPSFADFLTYSVVESSHDEPAYQATLEGRTYLVRKLREFLLIPLKTGALPIGSMTTVIQGGRNAYPTQGSPLGMAVESDPLNVTVVEPPAKGRPDGYFPGDVGSYRLEVDVQPKELASGEYAEVVVRIRGQGQIPTKVLLPESHDLIWEKPTMSGGPQIQDGKLQGERVLKYAVQVHGKGSVALGQVRLPYYDYGRARYEVARANLGSVLLKPAQGGPLDSPKAPPSAGRMTDTGLAFVPRRVPGAWSPPASSKVAPLWPWLYVLGLPLVVGLAGMSLSWSSKWSKSRATSSKNQSGQLIKEAKRALGGPDEGNVPRKLERALFDSIQEATGQNVRGSLREQIPNELRTWGLPFEICDECGRVLSLLDRVRYEPSVASPAELVEKTDSLVATLEQWAKRKSRKERAA